MCYLPKRKAKKGAGQNFKINFCLNAKFFKFIFFLNHLIPMIKKKNRASSISRTIVKPNVDIMIMTYTHDDHLISSIYSQVVSKVTYMYVYKYMYMYIYISYTYAYACDLGPRGVLSLTLSMHTSGYVQVCN